MATEAQMRELLTKAQEHIALLEGELTRLTTPPYQLATICQLVKHPDGDRLLVASGGGWPTIVPAPADTKFKKKLKAGALVTVHPMTGAITEVFDEPLPGVEVSVKRVFDDSNMLELEGGGSGGAMQVYRGDSLTKVRPGDIVLLDRTGQVALRVVQKDRTAHSVETATGVTWNDIGGQDAAKRVLQEAVEEPIKYAVLHKAYGKRPVKGLLLHGAPGCVDGDAEVAINRAGKGYKTTLSDLYKKFNSVSEPSYNNRTYAWDPAIPTFIRCLHEGELRLKQVVGVYDKGVKAVKRLTLIDGKQLLLTPDHEIKTAKGFVRTDTLNVGDLVYTNGSYISSSDGYEYQCSGLKNHPRLAGQTGGYELAKHILVAEAALNGLTFDEWLERISNNNLEGARFIDASKEVHHKDGVRTNNTPDNLDVVTRSEHCSVDGRHLNFGVFTPKEVAIAAIEDAGEIHVYDVTVDEAHNFVANGIVVHNCGKTLLAKACANSMRELHGKAESATAFIYVKGPEVLNMWVGNTEAQIRGLFTQAREHKEQYGYPAVLFIDEADAILGKRGGHHSSVLSSTIVPTFLAEMDGLADSGAFVLLATNRPDTLDPAVVREGRIDRKVAVLRPSMTDAAKILAIHLKRTKLADRLEDLAANAANELYSDKHHLYNVGFDGKPTLRFYARHLVSGAMLAGIVDLATAIAIQRDIKASAKAASGLVWQDMEAAIIDTVRANRGLNHDDDLAMFSEQHGHSIQQAVAIQRLAA